MKLSMGSTTSERLLMMLLCLTRTKHNTWNMFMLSYIGARKKASLSTMRNSGSITSGLTFTPKGYRVSEDITNAITNFPTPGSFTDLRSFTKELMYQRACPHTISTTATPECTERLPVDTNTRSSRSSLSQLHQYLHTLMLLGKPIFTQMPANWDLGFLLLQK
jgi:hypothetical protein